MCQMAAWLHRVRTQDEEEGPDEKANNKATSIKNESKQQAKGNSRIEQGIGAIRPSAF
jgi:hypothetical protein